MGRSPLLTSSTFSAHFCLAQYNKVFHIKKSSSSKIFYIHDCLRSWAIDYFWSEADWSRIDYAIVIIVVNDCGKKKKKAGKKSVVQNRNFQSRMGAPVGKPQNDGSPTSNHGGSKPGKLHEWKHALGMLASRSSAASLFYHCTIKVPLDIDITKPPPWHLLFTTSISVLVQSQQNLC